MELIKLKNLVDIYLGVTHTPEYTTTGVPFLSVKDISGGSIVFNNCKYISELEYDLLPNGAKPKEGDLLFCRVGTIGKPILIPKGTPKFGSFVSLGFLRNKDSEKCELNYLKYWMNSENFYTQVKSNVKGASQINLNTGWLSKFDVPLLPLNEQREIVEKFDKIQNIINLRKQQLQQLDALVKARFVELFWSSNEVVRLDSLIKPYRADKCEQNTYPVLSITMHNGLVLQSERFKKEIASGDKSQYKVVPRNKLVVAFPIDEGLLSAQTIVDVGIVSPAYSLYDIDENKIYPEVLEYILRSDLSIQYYKSKLRGTTLRRRMIPKSDFDSMPINLPSMDRQKQFLNEIKEIDKSKVVVQKALDEAQTLFDSLMQEYFG